MIGPFAAASRLRADGGEHSRVCVTLQRSEGRQPVLVVLHPLYSDETPSGIRTKEVTSLSSTVIERKAFYKDPEGYRELPELSLRFPRADLLNGLGAIPTRMTRRYWTPENGREKPGTSSETIFLRSASGKHAVGRGDTTP